jgi:hypothetical protein
MMEFGSVLKLLNVFPVIVLLGAGYMLYVALRH